MAQGWRSSPRRFGALLALPLVLLTATGCLTNAPNGMVATPREPGASTTASRLPQLLSQLQGSAGGGLELLDGSQSQVLAAQETGGKGVATATASGTPTPSIATPIGTARGGATTTPRPESATVTSTVRPGTATPAATRTAAASATTTATATASPTPGTTSTATPTATVTATATPIATPPAEGGGGTPPHE